MKENRRIFIKKFGYSIAFTSAYLAGIDKLKAASGTSLKGIHKQFIFNPAKERVWIGEDFLAVPMEDWSLKAGKIHCNATIKNARVNVLTTRIVEGEGTFTLSTLMGLGQQGKNEGAAGFSIGINDPLDEDVKAACYFGKGLPVGLSTKGELIIGKQRQLLPQDFNLEKVRLQCEVKRNAAGTTVTLKVASGDKKAQQSLQLDQDISGYIALVNNIDGPGGTRFWFQDLEMEGAKLKDEQEQQFGPILWTMYTLHRNRLKMSVQMPPLAESDSGELILQVKRNGAWKEIQRRQIDRSACQGLFRLSNWDSGQDHPYRIAWHCDGESYYYEGVVRQEPLGRPLRFGGLTCQHWQAYPYSPLLNNLRKHDPDMLYFSGDQLYEENGGYSIKRDPDDLSILSYLGKWYMFGWAFGSLMRDRPTICTPDDHDVFQGNLWGGDATKSNKPWNVHHGTDGGYTQSVKMVNVVHRTNCGHMPDCPDQEGLPSGITTWYTELLYAGVSFAIVSDRMFKSGPEAVRELGETRVDHLVEPVAPREIERDDLIFLGKRQLTFLERWIRSWEGSSMKVLLSQTLFANVGTHHGNDKMFLYGDMDSGGWPKKQRDEVIKILRKGYAFHINGDQHLPFLVQYSVDEKRDGGWTYCTPAISTGYIRWGQPDLMNRPFTDRPAHGMPNTGCYEDGFGNLNYIYAVGNPLDEWRNPNRYQQAQNKSSGFGIISFDLQERSIHMEAWRFLSDKDRPGENDQFPGWPFKISQTDNDGRLFPYCLPLLKLTKQQQLVKVLREDGELVNILRLSGKQHQFSVPDEGNYYLEVGEGDQLKRSKLLIGKQQHDQALEMDV